MEMTCVDASGPASLAAGLRMVLRQLEYSINREHSGDEEGEDRPERRVRSLLQHDNADAHGHDGVDHREPSDDQIGRSRRIRTLHEVAAEGSRREKGDDAERREPLEAAG